MIKYVLTFCLLAIVTTALAQQQPANKLIHLIRSTRVEGVKINGVDLLKVYNGVFQQDFSTLRSDSALFYPDQNMVDAFGHVNINQGDTLNIFSDKLNLPIQP